MDDIRAQIVELREIWEKTREDILTEQICATYIPGITLAQLDEVVGVVCKYLDQGKAPKGFAPTFSLARALALGAISTAIGSAKQIRAGTLTILPTFVASVNQALTAFHSLLVYSDKHDFAADLNMQQRETLELLDTAQRELRGKIESLEEATEIEVKLNAAVVEIDGYMENAKQGLEAVKRAQTESDEQLLLTKSDQAQIGLTKTASADLNKVLETLRAELAKKAQELDELNAKSENQAKVIDELLPKGASAGLAHAFAARKQQLELTKWVWMGGFAASIVGLLYVAVQVIGMKLVLSEDLWLQLLHRVPLATPLIWLGWFSAVQYGNTIRVQEDYAFKEATSKAFAGYRDHMEHLHGIDGEEGSNALEMLATKTIEILAREPLRIYDKPARDVSPAQSIASILKSKLARQEIKAAKEVAEE